MDARLTIPRATYRFQFHRGFTLRDALALVPYLARLGVSHLYASPLLAARPGSTHGYDGCDPTRLNPELGTEADLESLVAALRRAGMGLVLDIVPNHLGIGGRANPWWWDVLQHGPDSRFAGFFDIDWESPDAALRGKVLVPVLGDTAERVLERGELSVVADGPEVTVRYFDHVFPVRPDSVPGPAATRPDRVRSLNADRPALERFLEQQHYRLVFWREGDARLNYRRFFTITDLAGVRVEVPAVFEATHAHLLEWRQRGLLDGLRVDHPDGLSDPGGYLARLAQAAPGSWVVVEKILEPGEELPAEWPVAGTTGYDFLNRAGGLFIDPDGEQSLTQFYAAFTGEPVDYPALVRQKKRRILRHNLAAEVGWLQRLLLPLLDDRFPPEALRDALIEVIAAFPVYRTYVPTAEGPPGPVAARDAATLQHAVASARRERPDLATTFDGVEEVLLLRRTGPATPEFLRRFQQLTGPAMAKGVEDTVFYCFNRLVALNEVGGDPSHFGLSPGAFHQACARSRRDWPDAMLASSTHDTKRSEDVRARLALLSEIPDRWAAAVRRWSALNDRHRTQAWPDRNAEYLFYQTVVGAWPLPAHRAVAYLEKAAREAKQHTDWTDSNADYERALRRFVEGALADEAFLDDLQTFVRPLVAAGYANALAQTLIKLTAPGVPDLYQGTETWDFSLVDPDNRRPVDFASRLAALDDLEERLAGERAPSAHGASDGPAVLAELQTTPHDGRLKLFLIRQALQFRRQREDLFRAGGYAPLQAAGTRAKHVVAFARTLAGATAVTVVPRLVLGLGDGRSGPALGEVWEETRLVLPWIPGAHGLRDVLTGRVHHPRPEGASASIPMASLLERLPAALLVDDHASAASLPSMLPTP